MLKAIIKGSLTLTLILTLCLPTYAGVRLDAPSNSAFKSYMDYRCIKKTTSPQYAIQAGSITDGEGFRKYNDCYTVAVGTGWGAAVGSYIDVELSTGVVLHCVVGDIKANQHTDATNKQAFNGNVVEFIVDTHTLPTIAKNRGDVSFTSGKTGEVKSITVRDSAPIKDVSTMEAITTVAQQVIADEEVELPSVEVIETNEPACLIPEEPEVPVEVEGEEVVETSQEGVYKEEDEYDEDEYSQEGTYDDKDFMDYQVIGKYLASDGTYRIDYTLEGLIHEMTASEALYNCTTVGETLKI